MTALKVVLTDHSWADLEHERMLLEPLGCLVQAGQCRTEDEAAALVGDADYVITQSVQLNAAVVEAMHKARLIVRYGIGVDNIDLEAAARRGIPVFNAPGFCADEVADHALAMMLALTRQIPRVAAGVRQGRWTSPPPLEAFRALKDLTVGVVGCGRIGREVIERLIPFKARLLGYDPLLGEENIRALGCESVPLAQLWAASDLVTLHVPSMAETRHMINEQSLARMRDGVLLVNVSRGALVDTAALIAALQSGKVGGAALDVTEPEPLDAHSALLHLDNVIITSHVAWASAPARARLRSYVADLVARAVRGEPLPPSMNGVPA